MPRPTAPAPVLLVVVALLSSCVGAADRASSMSPEPSAGERTAGDLLSEARPDQAVGDDRTAGGGTGAARALAAGPARTSSAASRAAAASEPLPPLRVDLHVDTVTAMVERSVPWSDGGLEASLPALRSSGVDVVVQAAWIPRGDKDPRGTALGKLRRIRAMVQQSRGEAAIVTGPSQLAAVVREGRLAVVLALEGGTALVKGEETLRELQGLGLAMVGLTWTESSRYADSSAEPRAGARGGLTEAGRAMVVLCNDLGLMLDVSHMSDEATAQTVALSRAPVVASHSNSRRLRSVPRNLSDELAKAIAAKGGLIGVMFHGPFLTTGPTATALDVARHTKYFSELVGPAHVGMGSDWDGRIQSPSNLTSAKALPALEQGLAAVGLGAEERRWVGGDSFLRFWRAVVAERKP